MAVAYRFKTGQDESIPDNQKIIEEYETVESVNPFSIERLEQEIARLNTEINSLTTRKTALQNRIDSAKAALSIS